MVVGNLMSKSKLKYKEFNEFFKSSEFLKKFIWELIDAVIYWYQNSICKIFLDISLRLL